MVLYRSQRAFSIIEVILVLSLSTVVILIFLQGFNTSNKFKKDLQSVFKIGTTTMLSRNLKKTDGGLFIYDYEKSLGKRNCDLKNIELLQSIRLPDLKLAGQVTALNLQGNSLYIGLNSATSTDPDIVLVEIDGMSVVGTLNTGPGVAGFTLQGHYLFLANGSVNAQFQVVDLNNLSLVSSLKIPGSNSSKNPIATSISSNINASSTARIILGTQKSDLGEVFIADFDGSKLSFVNSYDTKSIVNDVFAEVNGFWVTSPSDDELVHYGSTGAIDYRFNADGQSGNGKRIDVVGDMKLLGRTYGRDELVRVEGKSKKIGGSINDLIISNQYVILLANIAGESTLQILKLDDFSVVKSVNLPVSSNRLACSGNKIFVGTASSTQSVLIYE